MAVHLCIFLFLLAISASPLFCLFLILQSGTCRRRAEGYDGMGCSAGRNAGPGQGSPTTSRLDPSSPDAISLVADRMGLNWAKRRWPRCHLAKPPAAGCARTLTGESSRGLEVVGWRWDMNPSTMMKFRAAALPLGYDVSRRGF